MFMYTNILFRFYTLCCACLCTLTSSLGFTLYVVHFSTHFFFSHSFWEYRYWIHVKKGRIWHKIWNLYTPTLLVSHTLLSSATGYIIQGLLVCHLLLGRPTFLLPVGNSSYTILVTQLSSLLNKRCAHCMWKPQYFRLNHILSILFIFVNMLWFCRAFATDL